MKLSRVILTIMMLVGFSSYAGATIINLGNGAFYYTGLTLTQPQNIINSYLSSLGSEGGNLSDVGLKGAGYKVPIPNNLGTAAPNVLTVAYVGTPGSDVPGQGEGDNNDAAPVPEPATMLLLGTGLLMFVASFKKLRLRWSA